MPVVEEAYSSDHLSSPLVFSGVCVGHCLSFYPCSFAIVLSVFLRFTDSDYPFGIVKLFFQQHFSYIVMVSFIDGGNHEYPENTADLSKITDKLYHIM